MRELSPGTILTRTLGESYSMHCTGDAEKRTKLPKGLYIIRLKPKCWIRGDGWTVTGLTHYNSEEHIALPTLKIPPMALTRTIQNKSISQHFESPHWQALGELRDIKLSTLNEEDDGGDIGVDHGSYLSWTTLALWLSMLLVTKYIAREPYQKNVLCTRKQPTDVPTTDVDEAACELMGQHVPRPTEETAVKSMEQQNTTPQAWQGMIIG